MYDLMTDVEDLLVEAALSEDGGLVLLDRLAGEGAGAGSRTADVWIDAQLDTLSSRERAIVCRHFGLDDEAPVSLEEIGEQMGLDGVVCHLEEQALRKLRQAERDQDQPALAGAPEA